MNLSLDEVLEYVSLGYLPPFRGSEARAYRFRMREVRAFGARVLGLTETDLDSAFDRVSPAPVTPVSEQETKTSAVSTTITSSELMSGGFVDFTAHDKTVRELVQQKDALFAQYGRYREQVGYRIGQLETLLDQEQRRRATAEGDAKVQSDKAELLKQKLLDARAQLENANDERARANRAWWRMLTRR